MDPSSPIKKKNTPTEEIKNVHKDEEDFDEDYDDDPIMHKIREQRMQELKQKIAETENTANQNTFGFYAELEKEKDFLSTTTSTKNVVCHFYHKEFTRCKIIDKHLTIIATKYTKTKFVKINVEIASFFVEKLQIKVLPCIVVFIDGIATDRIVGFAELGERDDFPTGLLEKRIARSGAISLRNKEIKRADKRSISESEHNKMNDDDDDLSD